MPPTRNAPTSPERRWVPARTPRRRVIRSSVRGGWRAHLWHSFSRLPNGGRGSDESRCESSDEPRLRGRNGAKEDACGGVQRATPLGVMMLTWTAPVALWLLALVPLLWLAPLVARTTFNP